MPGARDLEDGLAALEGGVGAADHEAVAAVGSPDAAAGAAVDVVDGFGLEVFGAADVVLVEGVAAVDEDVVGGEVGEEVGDDVVDDGRGDHEPDDAGGRELLDEVFEGWWRRSRRPW